MTHTHLPDDRPGFRLHVNIPFSMLQETYLPVFIGNRLNPEIGLDALSLERFSASDFASAADRLRDHDLEITLHAPFFDLSPGSPDPGIRELTRRRLAQVLALVPVFRPTTVVCHAAYEARRYGMMIDDWMERSLEIWSWFGENLWGRGSRLVLENVFEHGPGRLRSLLDSLQHAHAGFCLDMGHQHAFSRTPMEGWIEALGGYLCQMHLHDNHGQQDEHLAAGRGTIDFAKLFGILAANRYPIRVITLEPHRETDLRPSLDHLEKIPWFRKNRVQTQTTP